MSKLNKLLLIVSSFVFLEAAALGMAQASVPATALDQGGNCSLAGTPVVYRNGEYGFAFSLPAGWRGYTVVTQQWEGLAVGSGKVTETGPMLLLRSPKWTSANPTQDIPVMVFTTGQWQRLQNEEFHIGAAPIGPAELGRNNRYVFALPARYNFAFLPGWEEVQSIINSKPLTPFDLPSQ